jgi:Prolyl oligopeptidase family
MMNVHSGIRRSMASVTVIGAALLLAGGHVAAATAVSTVQTWPARSGPALSSDEVLKVTEIGGVSVQPGGQLVSFTTLSADPGCNCYHVKLNLLDLRTHRASVISDLGQPLPIPYPDGSVSGWPCVAESLWSDDGRYLAYIVNRRGHGVLTVYDSRAKESKYLSLGGDEAFGFTWAKSGERILYQAGGPRRVSLRRLNEGKTRGYLYGSEFAADAAAMPPLVARVPESRAYEEDDSIFASDRAWSDLRVVDVATGTKTEATTQDRAFAGTADFSYSQQPHQDATQVESSDGQFTLQLGDPDPDYAGPPVIITRKGAATGIRKSSAEVCPGRRSTRSVALAYWDATAQRFVLVCSQSTSAWGGGSLGETVLLDPVSGLSRALFPMEGTNPEGELGRQCDVAAGKMICASEDPSEPPALFALDLNGGASVRLYDPNEGLRRKGFPRVERLIWNNAEGMPTRADLVYPSSYQSHRRYPLVITQYVEGGFLRGNTGDENPIFAYAQSGFFVLSFKQTAPAPEKPGLSYVERNRRAQQGRKWRKSIQDSLDVVIQDLIDRGLVDPSRVAYTGLSGGANQIDYALANGRRMAVAITSTCCSDPSSWVVDPLFPDSYELMDLENPVTDKSRSKWSEISPAMHVDDIHTAILANVAEHERFGFQPLWARMLNAHKPMETYIYAGENHVKFQPVHLAAIQHRNIDWLRFWLQGYEDAAPAKADQYARWRRLRVDWCRHDPRCIRPPVSSSSGDRRP